MIIDMTGDPVDDFLRYDRECEKWREAWEATRPKCASCGEVIGVQDAYDFSGKSEEEGCVFCETCVNYFFDKAEPGELCEVIRESVRNDYRRKFHA